MTHVRAMLYNFRQSPRKVRLLAGLLRGQPVATAVTRLQQQPQKSATAFVKLIRSAIASATNNYGLSEGSLKVEQVMVDEAVTYKRFKPAARGAAHGIRRTGSTIRVVLSSPEEAKVTQVKAELVATEVAAPDKAEQPNT
jgi:large subunit ribosomal protein L22